MQTEIFDYGSNGEGVAKIDGKIALVPNSLVGEIVDISIAKVHPNYCLARAEHIIKASPNRTAPICPYYGECGGCDLQHFNFQEQLKFKALLVQKTLKKIADISIQPEPTVASEKFFNYRNKISLAVRGSSIGFFKKSSSDIVNVAECKIASEDINKLIKISNEYFKTNPNSEIKNIVFRDICNQVLVGVVSRKKIEISNFYTILSKNFKKIGLFLIINKRNDSVVLTENIFHIAGISEINIENFGVKYCLDLLGFHQTNLDVQNKIYFKVLELIGENKNIINGFSGSGLLSAILAKKAKMVYGIEINRSSHETSERLKKENSISNLKNIHGDFNKEFPILKSKADVLVIDPPKKGLGEFCKSVVGIDEIIYVSCSPIALAKDLRYLKKYYIIDIVIPFDMFPNTMNVETLVRLKRRDL